MEISELGFDPSYWKSLDFDLTTFELARVTAVNRDNFLVKNEKGEITAELTGKMLFDVESSLDYPTVGDWVKAQYLDQDTFAVIHEVLPRKSLLKRKDPGKKLQFQLIAANIDIAFIMQSLDANFNLNRLERYLVLVQESNIQPVILLSKSDLITLDQLNERIAEISRLNRDYPIIAFSNETRFGFEQILGEIKPAKTYCLLGSSGVGKTSLLNNLVEREQFFVKTIREKDGKGRHATTKRQLICLENGAMIIDTPGMRELGIFGVEAGLSETFADIDALIGQCHFSDCTHTHEKGCAVLAAVDDGVIDKSRYQNYMKIQKESEFYELSYVEKRKRDKKFGKFVKQVMKEKRKK